MTQLSENQAYPYPLAIHGGGAAAQFLNGEKNILQIFLPKMTHKEQTALNSGKMTAGFLYQSGALLWLIQFCDQDDLILLTFEAPFDGRLIPKENLNLHDDENPHQRLVIEVHAVDEQSVLRALRVATLPADLSAAFLNAVEKQLRSEGGDNIMRQWLQANPAILAQQIEMRVLGR